MENAYQDANPRVFNSLTLVWQTSFQEPLKVTIKPTVCGVSEVYRNKYGTCRGPGFTSQHSHGDSQSPVTPVPGDPTLLSDFCGLLSCAYGAHKYIQAHTNTHNIL